MKIQLKTTQTWRHAPREQGKVQFCSPICFRAYEVKAILFGIQTHNHGDFEFFIVPNPQTAPIFRIANRRGNPPKNYHMPIAEFQAKFDDFRVWHHGTVGLALRALLEGYFD